MTLQEAVADFRLTLGGDPNILGAKPFGSLIFVVVRQYDDKFPKSHQGFEVCQYKTVVTR